MRIFALSKPRGVICSTFSQGGAVTVYELLPEAYRDWFAVGRLDKDSEGLLLFCDDSRIAQQLMDPGRVAKTYVVTVRGFPRDEDLERMRRGGLMVDGKALAPVGVRRLGKAPRGGTRLEVTLHEGRNREIRRLFATAGFKVRRLVRVAIGPMTLADLAPGQGHKLTRVQTAALLRCVAPMTAHSTRNCASPHFSPVLYCAGGFCRAGGRTRRSEGAAVLPSTAPLLTPTCARHHRHLRPLVTSPGEKYGLGACPGNRRKRGLRWRRMARKPSETPGGDAKASLRTFREG